MNHCSRLSLATAFFLAALAPALLAADKPNVLFISADDMNCDLSAFGNSQVKTPNLERLCKMGVRFDAAYCQQPLCGPSRASLMTGLRPDTLDMHTLKHELRQKNPDVVTLGQMFRNNGYYSARSGKIYHYGNPSQIGTDANDDPETWDERHNPVGIDRSQQEKITRYGAGRQKDKNLGISMAWWDPVSRDDQHTDGRVAADIVELIEQKKDKPFFLAAGFFNPHCPYVAPKRYFDMYPLDEITMPDLDEARKDLEDVPRMAIQRDMRNWPFYFKDVTRDEARKCKQAYYATISFVDAQVGRLLDALEENDLMDNTIIVFWSDHGYFLGEKGLWYKRKAFERSARMPLVIAAPGLSKDKSTAKPVELLDLYPTLADLCGLKPPANLEGKSLRPLLTDPATSDWNKPAVTQIWHNKKAWGYSIRTERYRYTEWLEGKAGRELYDHSNDTDEVTNLAKDPKHATTVAELSALIKPYVKLKPYKRAASNTDSSGNSSSGKQSSVLKSGEFSVTQSWSQEKNFKRPYHVRVPEHASGEKLPVLLFLHGNGGNARGAMNGFMRGHRELARKYISVFPDGYRESWNIVSERSKANDTAFIEAIVRKLARHTNVQPNNFSIMGVSNGAALVNQLAIESRLPNIRNYISSVSPLNGFQHDGDNFKVRGNDNNYEATANPLAGKRLMNISGTEDKLVPYRGGRSPAIPAKSGKLSFVAAEQSTFLWAKQMGYKGEKLTKPTETEGKLEIFSYLNGDVVHYKVNDAGHGATGAISDQILLDFLAAKTQKNDLDKADSIGSRSIFDGKTLAGWNCVDMKYWSVRDGAITGESTPDNPCTKNKFIVWQGGELSDFELKVKFRVKGNGCNSGVQFRSKFRPDGLAVGYQADIYQGGGYLGGVCDEMHTRKGPELLSANGSKSVIDKDGKRTATRLGPPVKLKPWPEWNDYHIIAKGKHITLKMNGRTASELTDEEEAHLDLKGLLGLQLRSGKPMTVQFKNIRLQRTGKIE